MIRDFSKAKGWQWDGTAWVWCGNGNEERDDIAESLKVKGFGRRGAVVHTIRKDEVVEVLTEHNGWAIVYLHEKYFIKHLDCGTVLRQYAHKGCHCGKSIEVDCKCQHKKRHCKKESCKILPATTPVDAVIYGKFRLMTLRDPELKEKRND